MADEIKVAAFTGGSLKVSTSGSKGREVALALPASRLLVKVVRVPGGEDPVEFATPVLKAVSPFPDDPLAVSCETVCEDESGKTVIAAALPESATDDIGAALDEAKLGVVRIDSLELGALRGMWSDLDLGGGGEPRRTMLVLKSPGCVTLIVLDGEMPCSIRAIADESDMKRETMLSLLEAEDFNGPRALSATIEREIDVDAAMAGVGERAAEQGTLDALPDSWREELAKTRFKAKLVRNLAVAGGLWVLLLGVLFGVPVCYGFMTDHVKDLCREHSRSYRQVSEKKAKVKLIQKYSDHARGALEIMKAVSDRLPDDVTLTSWDFKREDGVRVRGEADSKDKVYEFKDNLVAMGAEDGGDPVFKVVQLGSVSASRDGRQKFEIDCRYEMEEE